MVLAVQFSIPDVVLGGDIHGVDQAHVLTSGAEGFETTGAFRIKKNLSLNVFHPQY